MSRSAARSVWLIWSSRKLHESRGPNPADVRVRGRCSEVPLDLDHGQTLRADRMDGRHGKVGLNSGVIVIIDRLGRVPCLPYSVLCRQRWAQQVPRTAVLICWHHHHHHHHHQQQQ
jgi:hypothetical protein